jgi:hypothetical protein
MSWRSHKFLRSQLHILIKEGKLNANNRYKALMLYAELTEDQERRRKTKLAQVVEEEKFANAERILEHIEGRPQ